MIRSWQRKLLKLLSAESAPRVFFETGTKEGETTAVVAEKAKRVEKIYTVELSTGMHEKAKAREFKNKEKVEFILGDSKDVLPKYTKSIECPVFWYLDAHYCIDKDGVAAADSFPLWEELEAVRDRAVDGDMIWVDDTHTFGKDRPDLNQPWEGVTTETILEFLGNRVKDSSLIKKGFVLWL